MNRIGRFVLLTTVAFTSGEIMAGASADESAVSVNAVQPAQDFFFRLIGTRIDRPEIMAIDEEQIILENSSLRKCDRIRNLLQFVFGF